jgi:hypothetical protein
VQRQAMVSSLAANRRLMAKSGKQAKKQGKARVVESHDDMHARYDSNYFISAPASQPCQLR